MTWSELLLKDNSGCFIETRIYGSKERSRETSKEAIE